MSYRIKPTPHQYGRAVWAMKRKTKWSNVQIATALGVSESTIRRWLRAYENT